MGGWVGGQAEYVLVPYADWNLLKFPDKDQAMEKILDLTMLSDIFPTGFHGACTAGVTSGSTVYVAGAGPVGLAAAYSALLLGAAVVIVGDLIPERLAQARSFGCETVDISKGDLKDQIEEILGVPEVDAAVDAVGFEARGHGAESQHEAPATVLNSIMDVTRAAGKLGIPGLYVTGDPGGIDEAAQEGSLSIRIGLGWAKSHSFATGQCPVMRYHHGLMHTRTSTGGRRELRPKSARTDQDLNPSQPASGRAGRAGWRPACRRRQPVHPSHRRSRRPSGLPRW
jgi:glutathione-independent formaldehyde dehydrogenase